MNPNWSELKREFERRRETAEEARDRRKRAIYGLIPEIKDLDRKIAETGIALNRELIRLNPDPIVIREFENKINALIENKKNLLKDNGYPEDYLDIEYSCKDCNDTGFLKDSDGKPGVIPCHCYRQLLVERFYDISNLNSDGQTGFEFFNEQFYPDVVAPDTYGIEESPRSRAIKIKSKCLDFINNFERADCRNLFFTGSTGVGKTFLSKCIAIEILKQGHTVLYLPAPAMFDIIYRCKYRFNDEEIPDDSYRFILDTDLLIIDDLGTESPSAAKYTELLTLLNYRSAKNTKTPCKTIISTNMNPKDIQKTYSERIASRILGEFEILRLVGDDIRIIRRLNQSEQV
ncbi:MAG: ATP-binding protein [Clostridiaceae bacterium]|mgnify:CR=1 FL=1|nr:ATP-binding protein [Clostridiaceae bacterium]